MSETSPQLLLRRLTTSTLPRSERVALADTLRQRFKKTLAEFDQSDKTFEVIYTSFGRNDAKRGETKTLFVLDSSFNPPTKAHLTLARNALQNDQGSKPVHMMFLLATNNADKAPKPAGFEDRLVMMSLMAHRLGAEFESIHVDVAVTKKPFFMDKAESIDQSGMYGKDTQQVHLTGYDTIVRIFNAKYYPEDEKLRVLDPFLSRHRLRVCYRIPESGNSDDIKQSKQEQEAYVEGIGDGSRESEGMKKEWRKMVELVDDAEEVRGVSSTEARKAAVEGRQEDLRSLLGDDIAEFVQEGKFYDDADSVKKDGIKPRD